MILEQIKNREIVSNTEEGVKTGIDIGSIHILQMLLSQRLYSDPITAVIAEYSNNAIDSIVESGKDPIKHPVIVELAQDKYNIPYCISFKDRGLGLSEEEFTSILGNYLNSTKRQSNASIGAFGIGSKSALSISDSFYYICRKDGIEIKMMMYKGAQFTEYQKIYESATTEENGVEVIIPIDGWSQYRDFKNKIQQKLCYYDTVVLVIDNEIIKNTINRNSLFQWSSLNQNNFMHFSLKDVYYTIDFDKLGIDKIMVPICIRFGLDEGLIPTPSREEIIYSPSTIALFKEKIKKISEWMIGKYNLEIKNLEITDIPSNINNFNPKLDKYFKLEEQDFNITELSKYSTISILPPKIKDIEIFSLSFIFNFRYKFLENFPISGQYYDKKATNSRYLSSTYNAYFSKEGKKILCQKAPSGLMKSYLIDTFNDISFFIERPRNKDLAYYKQEIGLKQYPKEYWRKIIIEWNKIEEAFRNGFEIYEDFVISDKWIADRKINRTAKKATVKVDKQEISAYEIIRGTNKPYITDTKRIIPITSLETINTVVYGTKEERENLYKVKQFDIKCYILPDRDIAKISLPNWITYSEFIKGDTAVFKEKCIQHKKYNLSYDLEGNYGFLGEVDDRVKKFVKDINVNIIKIDSEFINVAEKKDWWKIPEDAEYEYYLTVLNKVDLSFLEHIRLWGEGREIAKLLYNIKLKESEQTQKLDNRYE